MIDLAAEQPWEQAPETWRAAPRRWGHRWHSMCSYMAMFPPAMPRVFIDWLTDKGDSVYDPFSGRGTTVLEACTSGRVGLGSDANPLAWILSSSKAAPPGKAALDSRLRDLRGRIREVETVDQPPAIRAVFHPKVLSQLLWIRRTLDAKDPVDRHLYAMLLGILHANANTEGMPRGLTIAMPNTFSMSPAYIMRYQQQHGLRPPDKDVLEALALRIEALGPPSPGRVKGYAWLQDVTEPSSLPRKYRPVDLVFTSPPYLGVMKYAKLNWLRMWLIGQTPAKVDAQLFSSGSLDKYLDFMTRTLGRLQEVLSDNGRICLVVGDVEQRGRSINLAQAIADTCAQTTGMNVDTLISDELPVRHKVSRIWKQRRGQATRVDRVLVLSQGRKRRLPRMPAIDWGRVQHAEGKTGV